MAPAISVIIPAYNESNRLPPYLKSIRAYLQNTWGDQHEVIVVDDGSEDGLSTTLAPFLENWGQFVLLKHPQNIGKGAAVRTGMLAAVGEVLLFTDADGATPIEEEQKLRAAIQTIGADISVGSRLLSGNGLARARLWHRDFCGRLFAASAQRILGLPVRDSQCGFKMFRRSAAQDLFRLCGEPGYLFDLEILLSAQRKGYRIAEIPVSWKDVPGSKVRLIRDGWSLIRGLCRLRRSYLRRDGCQITDSSLKTSNFISSLPANAVRE